ncbi:MAG: hypothetical protein FJX76_19995 [Armatimonadetes bacterium]|nr:hypothetical protein [Armatimonadota bacterium]
MDKITFRSIATPYTLSNPSRSAVADVPTDGYAGSVPAIDTVHQVHAASPEPAKPAMRGRAIMFAALATVGILGGIAARIASAEAPQASVSQTVDLELSNPTRPMPDNAEVDTAAWDATAAKAFAAYDQGDASGLAAQASEGGVWVRGLPGSNGTTYMTKAEFTRDLQHRGPFQRHVFGEHGNARFVITPDAQARIQTILLD